MSEAAEKFAYTVDEAAKALSVSKSSLYKAVREGQLSTFKFMNRTLVSAEELRRVTRGVKAA